MKSLLLEYRKTLAETRSKVREIDKKIVNFKKLNFSSAEDKKLFDFLSEDKKIINSWVSNLEYSVEWLETGRRPRSRRGIERRSAYEKEIPFENYWIQAQKDEHTNKEFGRRFDEIFDIDETDYKSQLANEVTNTLTARQKEMLELSANGFTHSEIASILSVEKGTVDITISRSKKKIVDEGWFMS